MGEWPRSRASSVASATIPGGIPSSRGFQTEYRRRFGMGPLSRPGSTASFMAGSLPGRPLNSAPAREAATRPSAAGEANVTRTLPYRPGTALPPQVPQMRPSTATMSRKNFESAGWAPSIVNRGAAIAEQQTPAGGRPPTAGRLMTPHAQPRTPVPPSPAIPSVLKPLSLRPAAAPIPSGQGTILSPKSKLKLTKAAEKNAGGILRARAAVQAVRPPAVFEASAVSDTSHHHGGGACCSGCAEGHACAALSAPAAAPTASHEPTPPTEVANQSKPAPTVDGLLAKSGQMDLQDPLSGSGPGVGNAAMVGRSVLSTPRLVVPPEDMSRPHTAQKPGSKQKEADSEFAEVDLVHYSVGAQSGEGNDEEEPCAVGQAAPMVLNLENLAQSTPEVLEMEVQKLDIAQLEDLERRIMQDLAASQT